MEKMKTMVEDKAVANARENLQALNFKYSKNRLEEKDYSEQALAMLEHLENNLKVKLTEEEIALQKKIQTGGMQ